jgi:hypothetical protein
MTVRPVSLVLPCGIELFGTRRARWDSRNTRRASFPVEIRLVRDNVQARAQCPISTSDPPSTGSCTAVMKLASPAAHLDLSLGQSRRGGERESPSPTMMRSAGSKAASPRWHSTGAPISPTIPTLRPPASIRSGTSKTSAGRKAAIRTRISTLSDISRPIPTLPPRASIRSTTTMRRAGTRPRSVARFRYGIVSDSQSGRRGRARQSAGHFLQSGHYEGRSAIADGVWGLRAP